MPAQPLACAATLPLPTHICTAITATQTTAKNAQDDRPPLCMQGIRYSPTFRVFRDGQRVDEFWGPNPQLLKDRMWLHNDRAA
jgi:thioredoxin-like negative regulator of GroEL